MLRIATYQLWVRFLTQVTIIINHDTTNSPANQHHRQMSHDQLYSVEMSRLRTKWQSQKKWLASRLSYTHVDEWLIHFERKTRYLSVINDQNSKHDGGIAGLHVTSRRPNWWSRTKAFLSSGKLTLFSCKFFQKKFHCFDPQHGRLVTWLQTKNVGEGSIECYHSRGQHLCKFIGTKESVCIRKEFNSQRTGLGHQHGRRNVMWKHSFAHVRYIKILTWLRGFLVIFLYLVWFCLSSSLFWELWDNEVVKNLQFWPSC